VFDNGAADVLVGGRGRDLFYAGALDELVHWNPKKEVVVAIRKD
jgi:hypothetical protein